jgi:NAD(P)-dependent dehydrogenase (short-subunit alcohol dehydrogenase family)
VRGLEDKTVIVAGAGSGIGAATAIRLAEEGALVVVADVHEANAERVASNVVSDGGTAIAVPFDIADESSIDRLVTQTLATWGALHAVHVNAADLSPSTLGRDRDVLGVPLEVFDRTIEVNLRGHVLMTRRVVPELLSAGGGSIVYTASTAAISAGPSQSSYSMAKAGLLALSRHVAFSWGQQGVRANVVAPGLVLTEGVMERNSDGVLQERSLQSVRTTRLGIPADIAAAVAFLLSDDAAYINGQVLSVDGGTTMR